MIACDIHPLQNLRVLKRVGEEKKEEWAKSVITQGFDALEKMLEKTAGKYAVGDEVSLADCCIIPQVYNAIRFGVPMKNYPTLSRINEACEALEAFRTAHPSVQPDCFV